MMKNDDDSVILDQFQRPRRNNQSREVSSRFLSPGSITSSIETAVSSSPNQALSPTHRKSRTSSFESRKHRSQEGSVFVNGLWPSSAKRLDTLGDHLGDERLRDKKFVNSNSNVFLSKQKSSTEFSRFEPKNKKERAKENDRPIIGGSLRYSEKLHFEGKSVTSSSSKLSVQTFDSGRLSVDENALFGRSHRKSSSFKNSIDLESDCSDFCSITDFGSPMSGKTLAISSRKSGIMVSSKYMNDVPKRPHRGFSDSNIPTHPVSFDSSPRTKRFSIKNALHRGNSMSGHGSSMSQWALSPGRSGSPPMSVENKEKPMSFSSLKPVKTPSKAMGMEKLLNLGLDLFKSKKTSMSNTSSPSGPSISDNIHQLRMLHNRLVQWQFVNAKAHFVSGNIADLAELNLLSTWYGIVKMQQSVLQKKLQLQKERLEFKLNSILFSQLKPLDSWGDMERQHLTALSMTKKCLYSVICRVPLIEGAKIDVQTISIALRHASDLAVSIKSMLTVFAPQAKETASLLSELARVVAQEKLLLEESFELHRTISALEISERSLKCAIVQMKMQPNLKVQQHEEASIT